jgi:GNAT superfamily N-acetyltransferase
LGFGPGSYPAPLPSVREQLLCLLGQGWRVTRRWSRVHEELSEVHPPVRHCYLGLLGIRVEGQGQGLGAELLDAWLCEVDSLGLPAYLETDQERNLAFYSRAGFEVSAKLSVLGVEIWCMCRRPFPAPDEVVEEEAQEAAPDSIPGED